MKFIELNELGGRTTVVISINIAHIVWIKTDYEGATKIYCLSDGVTSVKESREEVLKKIKSCK